MLEKSFGLLFYLKPSKNQNGDLRTIYLRITIDGKPVELSTKRQWEVSRWNTTAARAAGNKEDSRALNEYLNFLYNQVYQAKKVLVETGRQITAQAIKNIMTGQGEEKYMILECFKKHNEQMKVLIGSEYAPSTLTRYTTGHDHNKNFIKWKYGVADLAIKEIDYEFISQFAFWLKSIRHCGHNAAMKYLGNFKKILLDCMRKGWLTNDPFNGFKTNRKEVIRVPLTKEELVCISKKDFDNDRLNQVKDIFLFSCFTGLAYVDVYKLKRSNIVKGLDGEQWVITNRQKTDSPTRLPLLPDALAIMNKYHDHPRCANQNSVLPVLTNQKMNSYLKEIADQCGINKNLTFHVARHTFATTVTLTNGVPIETVSKMLGHKSLKQTQHYAKIVDLKISQDMAALKLKLSTKLTSK